MSAHDQAEGLRELFRDRMPRLLNVTSGKPGAGRTTLVVRLAAELVKQGREVIVVDENTGMGNLADALGLRPRLDLAHALHGDRGLNEVFVPAFKGLRLLPAARGLGMLQGQEALGREARGELARALERADVVLVDAACGGTAGLSLPMNARRELLIATSVGLDAVTQTYAWIKTLPRQVRDLDVRVVVCKARRADEARQVFANLGEVAKRHLGMRLELLGVIGHDAELARAARPGTTLLERPVGAETATQCRSMAARLGTSLAQARPQAARPRPPLARTRETVRIAA